MGRLNKRLNMQAIGGLSVAVILILAALLAVVGTSVAMPFIGEQELKAGDYLVYSQSMTYEGDTLSYKATFTILEVGDDTMKIRAKTTGDHEAEIESEIAYTYEGGHLLFDSILAMFFVDISDVPDTIERSYSVSLLGFIPIATERFGSDEGFMKVKMGTNVVIEAEGEMGGGTALKMKLEDTNVRWLKLL